MKDFNQQIKIRKKRQKRTLPSINGTTLDLEKFVLQNYTYITFNDMLEETGCSNCKLFYVLQKLKVKAITQKEKITKHILAHYKTKSIEWMMKTCDIQTRRHINDLYKQLNIEEPVELRVKLQRATNIVESSENVRKGKTVAKILSNVHVPRNI